MITNMSAVNSETTKTFFYVYVVAEDQNEARSFLEAAIRNFRVEPDHSLMLVHAEPCVDAHDELPTYVFAAYGVEPPFNRNSALFADADKLSHLYTLPHLVDAPCFDVDDYND